MTAETPRITALTPAQVAKILAAAGGIHDGALRTDGYQRQGKHKQR